MNVMWQRSNLITRVAGGPRSKTLSLGQDIKLTDGALPDKN